jgi:hypothetical protein
MTQPKLSHHSRIALIRLANQGIATPAFAEPGDVVSWLGALQAQDYGGALWSIGLRMARSTECDIERAIAERAIVRTWPMRGTLHFVAAQDARWLLALLAPRMIAQSAGRDRQLALDAATFARSKQVFVEALQGGKQLTRDEMLQALGQAGISTAGQRGYHLLVRSAQDGLICFGVRRGRQHTFALLDEWIPQTQPLARDEALAELARRYVASHGPATLQDLARWAGLTQAEVRIGLEGAGKTVVRETVAGQDYWMSTAPPALPGDVERAFLLPGFDEYLLGYGDRSAVLDPAFAQRICPGGNGMFSPTIVIDGSVVGTWKRTVKKGTLAIDLASFQSLTAAENSAVSAAAERYGDYLGMPAVLTHASSAQ